MQMNAGLNWSRSYGRMNAERILENKGSSHQFGTPLLLIADSAPVVKNTSDTILMEKKIGFSDRTDVLGLQSIICDVVESRFCIRRKWWTGKPTNWEYKHTNIVKFQKHEKVASPSYSSWRENAINNRNCMK